MTDALLPCQRDARLRALDATVLSCSPAGEARWAVTLDQTPLYAEGGGQPADHGALGGARVLDVQRLDGAVVHTTDAPVPLGPARVEVDWARRFDHMQQHTAQHLLSALAEDRLGRPTVAFHLGAAACTIDISGEYLNNTDRRKLEDLANGAIREDRPVTPRVLTPDAYAQLDVRSRGLPDGHTGPVRLIEIDGLDRNTCGGTHVARLGELQAVALTRVEPIKGGSRLHFLAGGRVLHALHEHLEIAHDVTRLLTAPPGEHAASVARLQASDKQAAKDRQALLRELAGHLGRALADADGPAARHLHRDGADLGVLRAIADAALAARPDLRLLLTGEGVFLVAGEAEVVQRAGPAVADALSGRGGGRGDRFQGKASALDRSASALDHLRLA